MKIASKPNPVKRPLRVGTIQWTLGLELHPNQKRPAEKRIPPTITGGSLHSGTGLPPFFSSFLLYAGELKTIHEDTQRSPTTMPKNGRPATPAFM